MYYDPSNPASFGPNTSIAYGSLPAKGLPVAPATPATPAAPTVAQAAPATPATPATPAQQQPQSLRDRWARMREGAQRHGQNYIDRKVDRYGRTLDRLVADQGRGGPSRYTKLFGGPMQGALPFMQGVQQGPGPYQSGVGNDPRAYMQQRRDWGTQAYQAFNDWMQSTPDWRDKMLNTYREQLQNGAQFPGLLSSNMVG